MCPYMEFVEGKLPTCKPKNELCTMCVVGNAATYREIKKENNKSNKH